MLVLRTSRPHCLARSGRRHYAIPVNKKSSVDPLLGVAPPAPPKPQEDAELQHENSLPNFLKGTSRPNNPNDLSELLQGYKGAAPGDWNKAPNSHDKGKVTAALGAMRRNSGSAIPTEDIEDAFIPSEATNHAPATSVEVNPAPVDREHPHAIDSIYGRNDLDERILAAARALHHAKSRDLSPGKYASSVTSLMKQFHSNSDRTLSIELPNESTPKAHRRVPVTSAMSSETELQGMAEDGVLLIAYVTGLHGGRGRERITVCSGFAIEGGEHLEQDEGRGKGALVVSCAHTLRGSSPAENSQQEDASVALAVTRTGHILPITTLLSSLPSSDLVLLQVGEEAIAVDESASMGSPLRSSAVRVRTLPVNPYPAPVGSELCVSSFWGWEDDAGSTLPAFEYIPGSDSAPHTVEGGGTGLSALTISPSRIPPPMGREKHTVKQERDDAGRSRWGRARLVEYRDKTGREAKTGTYDDLAGLDFKLVHDNIHNPPALQNQSQSQFPPPGSSGGPIVDANTGAVVGITRGTKMSQLQGKRGDGIPAERLFFMFALPGFGKKT